MGRRIVERLGIIGGIKDKVEKRKTRKEKQIEDQLRGSAGDNRLHKELKILFDKFSNNGEFTSNKLIYRREFSGSTGTDLQYNVILRFENNKSSLSDIIISFNWQKKPNRALGIKKGFNIFVNRGLNPMDEGDRYKRLNFQCQDGDFNTQVFDELLEYIKGLNV